MIPTWVIEVGTVASMAVGFGLGWVWRGWRDWVLVLEELKKRGVATEDLA